MKASQRFINILWQVALFVAYRLLWCSWFLFRPASYGACVLVWHDGKLLMIRNSYKFEYTVPGGHVGRGEEPRIAAARELFEEVGIRVEPEALRFLGEFLNPGEFKKDHVNLFAVELAEEPAVVIDHREVVWADFMTVEAALEKRLFAVLRLYLEREFGKRGRR